MPGTMEFIDALCGEAPKRPVPHDAEALATALDAVGDVRTYCWSFAAADGELRVAARGMRAEHYVLTLSKERKEGAITFGTYWTGVREWTPGLAAELRGKLPFLRPEPLGPGTSPGLGDRLGIPMAGHARAVKGDGDNTGIWLSS